VLTEPRLKEFDVEVSYAEPTAYREADKLLLKGHDTVTGTDKPIF
jgi:hypothetical protein